jgi:hypothetical protein
MAESGNSRSRYILLLITLSQATRMSEVQIFGYETYGPWKRPNPGTPNGTPDLFPDSVHV